jgi:hypothetical protein
MAIQVGVYTRTDPARAWKFEQAMGNREAAALEREVNNGFGVTTPLIYYSGPGFPEFLDSSIE